MYQWKKGIAQWQVGKTLYLSVPFTWLLDEANQIAEKHKGKVLMGGPAFQKPQECEGFEPILFHNPCATFTSRGCPNRCKFCIVHDLEPEFKEIENFRPAPVICDNNFLACSVKHIERVIEKVKHYPLVDFQGIDARFVTPEKADILGRCRCKLNIGYDHDNTDQVHNAIELLKARASKNIAVYCIIGYNDTPKEAIEKLERIRSWKVLPVPMRYQPTWSRKKNDFLDLDWTERKMKDVQRYYFRLNYLGGVTFDEYEDRINGTFNLFTEI